MDIDGMEKSLNTATKLDMAGNRINVNDMIVVSEATGYGGNWLNRGIVTEKSDRFLFYIDIDRKENRRVIDTQNKVLRINGIFSDDEIDHFKELVVVEQKKKEKEQAERRLLNSYVYCDFLISDTPEKRNYIIEVQYLEYDSYLKNHFSI